MTDSLLVPQQVYPFVEKKMALPMYDEEGEMMGKIVSNKPNGSGRRRSVHGKNRQLEVGEGCL